MFIGGCAGSTACGIKIFRLQIHVFETIKKINLSNSVIIIKYNNHKISDDFIRSVIIFRSCLFF